MSVADLRKGLDVLEIDFFAFEIGCFDLGKGFDDFELCFGIFGMVLTDLGQGLNSFEVGLVNKCFHGFEMGFGIF